MSRSVTYMIIVVGIFLAIYEVVFFVRETGKTHNWMVSAGYSSEFDVSTDERTITFDSVDEYDFPELPIPAPGDEITAINDTITDFDDIFSILRAPKDNGDQLLVKFKRDGITENTVIQAGKRKLNDIMQIWGVQILRFLTALAYLLIGFWAFSRRPDSSGVRILTLFTVGMSAFMVGSVNFAHENFATFDIPYQTKFDIFIQLLTGLVPAFWLNLQLWFPRPINFVKKYMWITHIIVYLPQILMITLNAIGMIEDNSQSFGLTLSIMMLIQLVAGFFILARRRAKTEEALEKRQLSLVFNGTGIALGTLLILLLLFNIFDHYLIIIPPIIRRVAILWMFVALLLSPISFAIAFGRYRLLEVESKLKRGTRFILAMGFMLSALFGITWAIGEMLLRNLNIESRTPTLLLAMVLTLGVVPAQQRIKEFIERRFFPERYSRKRVIEDFAHRLLSIPNYASLWKQLLDRLRDAFRVKEMVPVIRNGKGKLINGMSGEEVPFRLESDLILRLSIQPYPLLVDEAIASRRFYMTPSEQDWLQQNNIALILPLSYQHEITGFLGLGPKAGEDFNPVDLNILTMLAPQVAMANENIRLLEDNLEKHRMEKQLDVARNIQQGFLPHNLPDTPGLDVAAKSNFCYEVAGDYYDVIRIDENKTVLALGDVSGKGAGAAMIMANLQASLRTALSMGGTLSEVVAGVNNLIHHNTPVEEYVTFFVAMYDSSNKELRYVNAGHNYPQLIRADNSNIELIEGGPVLGAIPHMMYEEGSIICEPGDMLLTFTDGVSEAMNPDGEEFGEDHLLNFTIEHNQETLSDLIASIQTAVEEYCCGEPFEDDFTLLLARIE